MPPHKEPEQKMPEARDGMLMQFAIRPGFAGLNTAASRVYLPESGVIGAHGERLSRLAEDEAFDLSADEAYERAYAAISEMAGTNPKKTTAETIFNLTTSQCFSPLTLSHLNQLVLRIRSMRNVCQLEAAAVEDVPKEGEQIRRFLLTLAALLDKAQLTLWQAYNGFPDPTDRHGFTTEPDNPTDTKEDTP